MLCIAHRLKTIAFYDLVVVMDQGRVAEFGPPFRLIADESSVFHSMCRASDEFDELYETAKRTFETE